MSLQESGEMYLETIFVLTKKSKFVRSVDVAEHMGYSKPSVSRAVKLLKDGGYINIDSQGYLSLTDAGIESAHKIYERHTIISKVLLTLGVDEKTATDDACRIEHVISDRSFDAMKRYLEKNNL